MDNKLLKYYSINWIYFTVKKNNIDLKNLTIIKKKKK